MTAHIRLLYDVGQALYGPQWQSALARDLGVSDRTVRRWAAGVTTPPAGVYADLLRLTQERAERLLAIASRLKDNRQGPVDQSTHRGGVRHVAAKSDGPHPPQPARPPSGGSSGG
jgi:DNA-binding transcriptional regulator YdaS (Cro superfamily)